MKVILKLKNLALNFDKSKITVPSIFKRYAELLKIDRIEQKIKKK